MLRHPGCSNVPRQSDCSGHSERIAKSPELCRAQEAFAAMFWIFLYSTRRILMRRNFVTACCPVPDSRNERQAPVGRAGRRGETSVKAGDIASPDVCHATRTQCGQKVKVQKLLICVHRSAFELWLCVQAHKVVRDLVKGPDPTFRAALLDGIGAFFHSPQDDLGFLARLRGREATMNTECNPPRPTLLSILRHVDLFAARIDGNTETHECCVPNKFTIPATLTPDRIDNSLADSLRDHGSLSARIPVSPR
jgi:hypothetical protein